MFPSDDFCPGSSCCGGVAFFFSFLFFFSFFFFVKVDPGEKLGAGQRRKNSPGSSWSPQPGATGESVSRFPKVRGSKRPNEGAKRVLFALLFLS